MAAYVAWARRGGRDRGKDKSYVHIKNIVIWNAIVGGKLKNFMNPLIVFEWSKIAWQVYELSLYKYTISFLYLFLKHVTNDILHIVSVCLIRIMRWIVYIIRYFRMCFAKKNAPEYYISFSYLLFVKCVLRVWNSILKNVNYFHVPSSYYIVMFRVQLLLLMISNIW